MLSILRCTRAVLNKRKKPGLRGDAARAAMADRYYSSIATIAVDRCPRGCAGHGSCIEHTNARYFPPLCMCELHWMGDDCAERRSNPYNVKAHGTPPHWPELDKPERLRVESQRWSQMAGVSCGGADHARSCAECVTTGAKHCQGECSLNGTNVCVLTPDLPPSSRKLRRPRPKVALPHAQRKLGKGRGRGQGGIELPPLSAPPGRRLSAVAERRRASGKPLAHKVEALPAIYLNDWRKRGITPNDVDQAEYWVRTRANQMGALPARRLSTTAERSASCGARCRPRLFRCATCPSGRWRARGGRASSTAPCTSRCSRCRCLLLIASD